MLARDGRPVPPGSTPDSCMNADVAWPAMRAAPEDHLNRNAMQDPPTRHGCACSSRARKAVLGRGTRRNG